MATKTKRKNRLKKKAEAEEKRNQLLQASSSFHFDSPVEIQSASGGEDQGPPTFEMMAYAGGKFFPRGFRIPVIVELVSARVYTPAASPVYRDHDPSKIVGHGKIVIDRTQNQIRIDNGVISAVNEHSEEVIKNHKNGFPWRSSLGASGGERQYISSGEKVTVNGKTHSGPVIVAKHVVVNEISFVSLGGEKHANAKIAASYNPSEVEMTFEQWAKEKGFDIQAMGNDAVNSLKAMYENENAEVETSVPPVTKPAKIDASLNVDEVISDIRNKASDEQGRVSGIQKIQASLGSLDYKNGDETVDLFAHAIKEGWSVETTNDRAQLAHLRAGRGNVAIHSKQSGELSTDLIEAGLCQSTGLDGDEAGFDDQVMQAAHDRFGGNLSLQEVMIDAANSEGGNFRRYRGEERGVLQAAFTNVSLPVAMSNVANKHALKAWNHVSSEWEKIAHISRVDDFKEVTHHRLNSDMLYKKVGKTGELHHGSLSEETFGNKADTYGVILALTRTDLRNDDLGQLKSIPTALGRGGKLKVNKVFWEAFLKPGFFGTKTNSLLKPGSGEVAPWYLIADPFGIPVIDIAFLDGRRVPYIESTVADFDTLGVKFRAYHDFGVRQQDSRGGLEIQMPITYENLKKAEQEWDKKLDSTGEPLPEDPAILLTPTVHNQDAVDFMASGKVQVSSSSKQTVDNMFQDRWTIVKSKYLPNS